MDLFVRTIGLDRTRTQTGLADLAYNFQRPAPFAHQLRMRCDRAAASAGVLLAAHGGFAGPIRRRVRVDGQKQGRWRRS